MPNGVLLSSIEFEDKQVAARRANIIWKAVLDFTISLESAI